MRKAAPQARDFTNQRYQWGSRADENIKAVNRTKSCVRAKVEHTIGVIKRVFGFQKVRYRGVAKNLHRLERCAGTRSSLLPRGPMQLRRDLSGVFGQQRERVRVRHRWCRCAHLLASSVGFMRKFPVQCVSGGPAS